MSHPPKDPVIEAAFGPPAHGDASVARVVSLIYDELREVAQEMVRGERPGHTLSATAVLHEAYVRLADRPQVVQNGERYFFAAARSAMRRVLVDYARRRNSLKRGGGVQPLTLHEAGAAMDGVDVELLDLDRALTALEAVAPRQAQVVECRFFAGLSLTDTAEALGVTDRTVKRDWRFARAWLLNHLDETEGVDTD